MQCNSQVTQTKQKGSSVIHDPTITKLFIAANLEKTKFWVNGLVVFTDLECTLSYSGLKSQHGTHVKDHCVQSPSVNLFS